jgi:hypothetical protein
MADSIAKLAVIITGDANPLTQELNRAKREVNSWASGMANMKSTPFGMVSNDGLDRWSAGLQKIKDANTNPFESLRTSAARFTAEAGLGADATFRISKAALAGRGMFESMVGVARMLPPQAQAAIALTAAFGIAAHHLASISDAQRVAAGDAKTWAAEWDKVQDSAHDIAVVLGRPIANVLRNESEDLAAILRLIANNIMPESIRQEKEMIALREKQAVLAKIAAEKQAEAQKRAAEEARLLGEELERQGREMESRADALARSLRTPREEMVAAIAEASQLMEAGFLSAQNFERAAESAKEKFREASKIREKSQTQAAQGIAATDRFTMAGFSAVQQASREMQALEAAEKEQIEELKKQTEVEQEIAKILNDRLGTPIILMEGTPP